MKVSLISNLKEQVRSKHPRTRKAHVNTAFGLLIKGGSMLISLILVPLTLDYLTKETYGTWLTISSIVTMLTLLDIGIGNGLRNKFSEAVANHDTLLARRYVSTAYVLFGSVQLLIISFFLSVIGSIPWQKIFNTSIDNQQLEVIVGFTVSAMAVKLVLDILTYVILAIQENKWAAFITFVSNLLVLLGTYILTHLTSKNLIYLATMTALIPVFVLSISSLFFYRNKLIIYKPSLKLVSFKDAKDLLSLGYKFFVIQIAVVVVFYSDNIIITHLFGPGEVTTYNISFRYFNAVNMLFAIAISPYWSAFTEASVRKELIWVKRTYAYLKKLWLVLVFVVIIMICVADRIYNFWIGDRVMVPFLLNVCMGLFIIISCWNSIAVSVANGMGKVKLQLFYSLASALINIPLAVFFGRILNMGSAGVILATSMALLIGSTLSAIQAEKLVTGTAKGVWNL